MPASEAVEAEKEPASVPSTYGPRRPTGPTDLALKVKGSDDVMVYRAKCCNPIPGEAMVGSEVELIAHQQPGDSMMPYERLLGDAMRGDASLFGRYDSVEEAWRVVDPILGNCSRLVEYEPNTWGPTEANGVIANGGHWHNPV